METEPSLANILRPFSARLREGDEYDASDLEKTWIHQSFSVRLLERSPPQPPEQLLEAHTNDHYKSEVILPTKRGDHCAQK